MNHYFKNKSTMKKAFFSGMTALSLFSAKAALAATSASLDACSSLKSGGLAAVVTCFVGILNNIVIVLMAAAVVYVIYGAFEMIRSEEKRESGRQIVVYGIIGLFVMVSVWGFVYVLQSTFNLSGGPINPPALTN